MPGLSLSQWDGATTSLAVAQVKASDWLPGTVAAIYGVEAGDPEQLAKLVAIREHAARRFAVHPSEIVVHGTNRACRQYGGCQSECVRRRRRARSIPACCR